jgi:hypothetical protein
MKRVLLTLLVTVLLLGSFAAVGYTGYRFGYTQGVQVAAIGEDERPAFRPFDEFGPRRMPMHPRSGPMDNFGFGRDVPRGFRGFPMMGFGFFSPLMWIGRLAVLALIVWFVYWLFTRSGWQLTRRSQTTEASIKSTETEAEG